MNPREIDALIAERIEGWTQIIFTQDDRYTGWPNGEQPPQEIPFYATDPAACVRVLENIAKRVQPSGDPEYEVIVRPCCEDVEVEILRYQPGTMLVDREYSVFETAPDFCAAVTAAAAQVARQRREG